jgi:hypothetical protein
MCVASGVSITRSDTSTSCGRQTGLQVGSLWRTYHVTDPAPGFLVGCGALPTAAVSTACQIFAQALEQVDHATARRGWRPNGS